MDENFRLTPLSVAAKSVVVMTPAQRRVSGLVLGALLGLAYGFVAQYINTWVQPGLNYYLPPFGGPWNVPFFTLLMLGIGLVCAWPQSTANGVILSGALCALVILVSAYASSLDNQALWVKGMVSLAAFLPFAGGCIPVMLLFRWAVNEQGEEIERSIFYPRRFYAPLIVLLLAAALGLTNKYGPEARMLMLHTDQAVQAALTTANPGDFPVMLRPPDVLNFHQQAGDGRYRIQWVRNRLNAYGIPSIATSDFEKSAVILRFESGWNIVCLYPSAEDAPECRGYDQLKKLPFTPQTEK